MLPPLEIVTRDYPSLEQELQLLYIRSYLTNIKFSSCRQQQSSNLAEAENGKLLTAKAIARAIAKAYPELEDTCKKQYKLDFQVYFPTVATTPDIVYSRTINCAVTDSSYCQYWFGDPAACLSSTVYDKLCSKQLTSRLQPCDTTDETWDADKRCFLRWGAYYNPDAKFVIGVGMKRRGSGTIIAFKAGCGGKASYYTNKGKVKSTSGLLGLVPLTCVKKNQEKGVLLPTGTKEINLSLLTNGSIIAEEKRNLILECITDRINKN